MPAIILHASQNEPENRCISVIDWEVIVIIRESKRGAIVKRLSVV